jgi:asparagine synthetase B (glutamine-hydrolysing)
MAWGLEARVPFLDKAFLEVALNTDAEAKMFNKGKLQEVDEDGCPRMEKVSSSIPPGRNPYTQPNVHVLMPVRYMAIIVHNTKGIRLRT